MICPGDDQQATNLTSIGCHMARMWKKASSITSSFTKTEYNIHLSTGATPGDFRAQIVFSNHVNTTATSTTPSVAITSGTVSESVLKTEYV